MKINIIREIYSLKYISRNCIRKLLLREINFLISDKIGYGSKRIKIDCQFRQVTAASVQEGQAFDMVWSGVFDADSVDSS